MTKERNASLKEAEVSQLLTDSIFLMKNAKKIFPRLLLE